MRNRLGNWIQSNKVQNIIIALILVNAITIGLETSKTIMLNIGNLLLLIDNIILTIFVLEILIKLYSFDIKFFKDPWNIFDFLIVAIALLPSSGSLAILRVLRIIRTLRLIKNIPRLRFLIETLLKAIPSLGWIFLLLSIFFYVYAVVGTKLFGAVFPDWFGTLGKSMYTLFQIMTLESWSMGIARPILTEFPYAFIYFVSFILISTYTTLNIFIAIVVNTMSEINKMDFRNESKEIESLVKNEHEELLIEIDLLKQKLEKISSGIENLIKKK